MSKQLPGHALTHCALCAVRCTNPCLPPGPPSTRDFKCRSLRKRYKRDDALETWHASKCSHGRPKGRPGLPSLSTMRKPTQARPRADLYLDNLGHPSHCGVIGLKCRHFPLSPSPWSLETSRECTPCRLLSAYSPSPPWYPPVSFRAAVEVTRS